MSATEVLTPHAVWKQQHREQLPRNFYACDVDLLIQRRDGRIAAVVEWKSLREKLNKWGQVSALLHLRELAPVYLATGELPDGPFHVAEFLGVRGDLSGNDWEALFGAGELLPDWEAWRRWEGRIRTGGSR